MHTHTHTHDQESSGVGGESSSTPPSSTAPSAAGRSWGGGESWLEILAGKQQRGSAALTSPDTPAENSRTHVEGSRSVGASTRRQADGDTSERLTYSDTSQCDLPYTCQFDTFPRDIDTHEVRSGIRGSGGSEGSSATNKKQRRVMLRGVSSRDVCHTHELAHSNISTAPSRPLSFSPASTSTSLGASSPSSTITDASAKSAGAESHASIAQLKIHELMARTGTVPTTRGSPPSASGHTVDTPQAMAQGALRQSPQKGLLRPTTNCKSASERGERSLAQVSGVTALFKRLSPTSSSTERMSPLANVKARAKESSTHELDQEPSQTTCCNQQQPQTRPHRFEKVSNLRLHVDLRRSRTVWRG